MTTTLWLLASFLFGIISGMILQIWVNTGTYFEDQIKIKSLEKLVEWQKDRIKELEDFYSNYSHWKP